MTAATFIQAIVPIFDILNVSTELDRLHHNFTHWYSTALVTIAGFDFINSPL